MLSMPGLSDAEEIFTRYASDPDVTRYMAWPRHQSVADTNKFLAFSASEWARWPAGPYLIRLRHGGPLVGSTGLHFERPDVAETGYLIAKDAWGHGYATEALQAMVNLAGKLGVTRLFAPFHPDNHASRRVLEKCGFRLDEQQSRRAEFPNLEPGRLILVPCYEWSPGRRATPP
jgi:ribosomal-protein-alanine N-acetyltransferase